MLRATTSSNSWLAKLSLQAANGNMMPMLSDRLFAAR
jgi:hypothetical protein